MYYEYMNYRIELNYYINNKYDSISNITNVNCKYWCYRTSACEKIKFVLGWRASSPRSGECRGAIASEKKRNDNEEDKDDAVEE